MLLSDYHPKPALVTSNIEVPRPRFPVIDAHNHLGAEFGGFIKSIRLSNTELNTGEVKQFSLTTEKYITFLSAVTPEYFILLVLKPDGNYGRARFELAKAKLALRDELT